MFSDLYFCSCVLPRDDDDDDDDNSVSLLFSLYTFSFL